MQYRCTQRRGYGLLCQHGQNILQGELLPGDKNKTSKNNWHITRMASHRSSCGMVPSGSIFIAAHMSAFITTAHLAEMISFALLSLTPTAFPSSTKTCSFEQYSIHYSKLGGGSSTIAMNVNLRPWFHPATVEGIGGSQYFFTT